MRATPTQSQSNGKMTREAGEKSGVRRRRNPKKSGDNKNQNAKSNNGASPKNSKTTGKVRPRPRQSSEWKWTSLKIGGSLAAIVVSLGIGRYWSNVTGTGNAMNSTGSNNNAIILTEKQKTQLRDLTAQDDAAWDRTDTTLNATHSYLSSFVCDHPDGMCSPKLLPVPSRRTHRVKENAMPGEALLVLPRVQQIWDLDALRDTFVRTELIKSRHASTGNPLDSGAYLAAHLIRRQKLASGSQWMSDNDRKDDEQNDDDPMMPYFTMLPTYDKLAKFHPVLWTQKFLLDQLGKFTPAVLLVFAFRDMMESEYEALSLSSTEFANNVDREEYMASRINVMSRSFGPGPPTKEEEMISSYGKLQEELLFYKKEAGIDLTLGCRAMSPILDTWDSHPHANAHWKYDPQKQAFVIWASERGIPKMHDVIVSYGRYSDSFLFAKFGYVNGDGTSHTEAYLNANHRLLDVGLMQQFSYLSLSGESKAEDIRTQDKELVRYLIFDDGYEECIKSNDDAEMSTDTSNANNDHWALKRLKFRMLKAIANQRDRWVMKMSPRNTKPFSGFSSAVPTIDGAPHFDIKKLGFDASKVVSTCRLIALTNDDYQGEAIRILTEVLANSTAGSFLVEKQSDALEYRAASCVFRLVDMMRWRYPNPVPKEMALLDQRNPDGTSLDRPKFGSKEWYAAHVRLGEMQSLEVLGGTMKAHAQRLRSQILDVDDTSRAALTIRRKPCPLELSMPLLEE